MRKNKGLFRIVSALILIFITISFVPAISTFAVADDGSSMKNAKSINLGVNYTKIWENTSADDFYTKFTVPEKGYITFKFNKPQYLEELYNISSFTLLNESGSKIWETGLYMHDYYNRTSIYEFSIGVTPGIYYLNTIFKGYLTEEKAASDYIINFTKSSSVELEPNDDQSKSTEVTFGDKVKGFVGLADISDDEDYYKVYVPNDTYVKVTLDNYQELMDSYTYLHFYNSSNKEAYMGDWKYSSDDNYYYYVFMTKGYNYFMLEGYRDQIEYNLSFEELSIGQPQITGIKKIGYNAQIIWTEVPGAEGYSIYRSNTIDGVYEEVEDSVSINEGNIYNDYVGSKLYYYKVRAYKEAGTKAYGEYSAPVNFTNNVPKLEASNVIIIQGMNFNSKSYATATDVEDGNITNTIEIWGDVNTSRPGVYSVTYSVEDIAENYVEKEIEVKVVKSDWYSHWGFSAIKLGMEKGIVDVSEKFRPEDSITRAEFIKLVNKTFGYTQAGNISFKDVKSASWFYNDIKIAAKAGYISTANDTFRPDAPITREEVAVILANLMKIHDSNYDKLTNYTDKNKVSPWAKSSVEGVIEAGYMGKGSSEFRPQDKMVRAEAVTALSRIK